jgi:BNR repeat-like domain
VPGRSSRSFAASVLAVVTIAVGSGSAADAGASMTQREFVRSVKRSPLDRILSGPAREGLRILTGARTSTSSGEAANGRHTAQRTLAAGAPANVRVNDPSNDGAGDPDMTEQNEVTLAVSGSNVVAGYNDDGTSPPPFGQQPSPATDITGYSWSGDGGQTWHDSQLPNHSPSFNIGDPVLAADRAGRFYFATLSLNFGEQRIDVAVSHSDDGGQTFVEPVVVSSRHKLTMNDKPWMTVGPDPTNPANDVVYVSWMESFFDQHTGAIGTRIMLTSSRDQGATWRRPVEVFTQPAFLGKQALYVNGSSLAVDPATGRVYLAWEQFVDRPQGGGRYALRREQLTHSEDGGITFARRRVVALPGAVGVFNPACGNAVKFGAGRLVRIQEFPSIGVGPAGEVLLAFDSQSNRRISVRVARSTDGGATWSRVTVAASPDAFMPALSADDTGASIVFYQRVPTKLLKAAIATSTDGATWTTQDLSDAAFPVPITFPSFDPSTAPCYMGDYLGVQRVAGTSYTGWGDNRDVVVNRFWPNGRPDPDVFFAEL